MLEDRSYMREDSYGSRRSVTLILLVTLVGIWLVENLIYDHTALARRFSIDEYFALSNHGMRHGRLWQLITFQFLHDGPSPMHLIVNCITLFFFGRAVEETLGPKGFLKLFFIGGLLGGLLQVLVTLISPLRDVPVVGAS